MGDREFLLHAFKGDAEAVELVLMLARLSHIWDDLVDKDKAVDDAAISEAFWLALIQIPGNGFYRRHGEDLRPVMATGILNWVAATAIERRPEKKVEELEIAHGIRYSVADVMPLIATIVGGASWAFEVAAELRLRAQKNHLSDYLKEHQ